MWYVIQVKTGGEKEAAAKLKSQGIRALVPLENRPVRSGGSWTKKEYVLFSGYVFLDMDYTARNYYRIREVPGVIRFLGDPKAPATLSYLETEWIRFLGGKDGEPLEPTLVKEDADGNLVAVDGILEKFAGQVVKWDRRSRRAVFAITICGERREAQLGIRFEEEEETLSEAGADGADGAAEEVLQEAT